MINIFPSFLSQVITNVGLCIALFDILKMGDSFIFPGDGASHTKVEFRFIVFRPFIDEIIVGKIKSCSKDGVCGKHFLYYVKHLLVNLSLIMG